MRYFIELQKRDGTGRGTCATVEEYETSEKKVAFSIFARYIDNVRGDIVDADGVQLYAGKYKWNADLIESWSRI